MGTISYLILKKCRYGFEQTYMSSKGSSESQFKNLFNFSRKLLSVCLHVYVSNICEWIKGPVTVGYSRFADTECTALNNE